MDLEKLSRNLKDVNVGNGIGRPSKFEAETARTFLHHVSEGQYPTVAARLSRVSYDTVLRWIRTGLAAEKTGDDRPEMVAFCLFVTAFKEAEAKAEAAALSDIQAAGRKGNWQALAWFLERRFPERYGKVDRKEVTARVSGKVELTVSVEQKRRMLLELQREVVDAEIVGDEMVDDDLDELSMSEEEE